MGEGGRETILFKIQPKHTATVETFGFDEFESRMNRLTPTLLKEADVEVNDAALFWEEKAKEAAPVNTGFLRNRISVSKTVQLQAEVVSSTNYSPYVEWGTGTRVSVPSELQAYALTFKGKKRTIGRFPHPFFFIQRPLVEKKLMEGLNRVLAKL